MKLQAKPSPIHGMGAFANVALKKGEVIIHFSEIPRNFDGFNHSCAPNAKVLLNDSACFIALRDIRVGEELTVDYYHGNSEHASARDRRCNCGACDGVVYSFPIP